MAKAPSELEQALAFAAAEAKQARTFLLVWETDGQMHVRTHPPSAALLVGMVLKLSDHVWPDAPDDDDDDD